MLTIITSTLNLKTISKCLKSISPLSRLITQHIIVDGGSSDNTLKKIRSLSNNLINIELYELKNQAYTKLEMVYKKQKMILFYSWDQTMN